MLHEMVVLSAGLPTSRDRKIFNALAMGMCKGWSMGLSKALNLSSCLNFLFLAWSFSFCKLDLKVTAVRMEEV